MRLSTILALVTSFVLTSAKVNYDVRCSEKLMTIEVDLKGGISQVYSHKLKGYPACYPKLDGNKAKFNLPLDGFMKCPVTKVLEKHTGRKIFYHNLVAESAKSQEKFLVSCEIPGHVNITSAERTRRQALPVGFREPETLTISEYIVERAPIPYLTLDVKQNGKIVDTTLIVQPGSLLEMNIHLDEGSQDIYGLLASYLKVTDNTPNKEEKIIENGCAVDPYIFGNFYTVNGDHLSAKFRAFKFPKTNFVLFIGTVNVCLQKCRGVQCGNGQIGYGRKKRAIATESDPNKAYQVELQTLIRVERSAKEFSADEQNPWPKGGQIVNGVGKVPFHFDDENIVPAKQRKNGGCNVIYGLNTLLVLVTSLALLR